MALNGWEGRCVQLSLAVLPQKKKSQEGTVPKRSLSLVLLSTWGEHGWRGGHHAAHSTRVDCVLRKIRSGLTPKWVNVTLFRTRVFADEGHVKEVVLDEAGPEFNDRILTRREECRHRYMVMGQSGERYVYEPRNAEDC